MQIIFLQTDGLFYNLYHSMTLEGYTKNHLDESEKAGYLLFQWGSQAYQRLADLVVNDISAEAAELYGAWRDTEARRKEPKEGKGWF